jgi:hypothetical protein
MLKLGSSFRRMPENKACAKDSKQNGEEQKVMKTGRGLEIFLLVMLTSPVNSYHVEGKTNSGAHGWN